MKLPTGRLVHFNPHDIVAGMMNFPYFFIYAGADPTTKMSANRVGTLVYHETVGRTWLEGMFTQFPDSNQFTLQLLRLR